MTGQGSKAKYEQWHEGYPVDTNVDTPWHQLLLANLARQNIDGRTVLEIACGRGGLACRLIEQAGPGTRLAAADFSYRAVKKGQGAARGRRLAGIHWLVADAQLLPFADNTFDTVISCETVEHLTNVRAALGEFARVLRPNGRLFLTTPNYFGLLGIYRGYMRLVGRRFTEEGQPINRFLMLPLTIALMRRAGLNVELTSGVGHYLPWPGRPPIRFPRIDAFRPAHWFAHHSLVIARKRYPQPAFANIPRSNPAFTGRSR
jgi:SAM-dependent methyltransferase